VYKDKDSNYHSRCELWGRRLTDITPCYDSTTLNMYPGGPKKRGQCILLLVSFKRLDQM